MLVPLIPISSFLAAHAPPPPPLGKAFAFLLRPLFGDLGISNVRPPRCEATVSTPPHLGQGFESSLRVPLQPHTHSTSRRRYLLRLTCTNPSVAHAPCREPRARPAPLSARRSCGWRKPWRACARTCRA